MNALNGVWSDTFQKESQHLIEILQGNLMLKIKLPVKIKDIHKIEKKNSIGISV